jgi:hypothetical protein
MVKPLINMTDYITYQQASSPIYDGNYPTSARTEDTFTITGTGFGTKPTADKSKVYWDASLGINGFNSELSRDTAWQSTPLGEVSTAQVSAGATQSVRYDLSLGGAVLAEHTLTGSPDRLLMFRRRYDDFDVDVDYVRRTRITKVDLTGVIPTAGQVVTGSTSGATGVVQSVLDDGTRYAIFYEPTGGTINGTPSRIEFTSAETMTWSGGSSKNDEGTGILEGFNNKIMRCWKDRGAGTAHYGYFSEGNAGYGDTLSGRKTQKLVSPTSQTNYNDTVPLQAAEANTWVSDLFLVDNSSEGVADGKFIWWKGSNKSFESTNVITNEATRPGTLDEFAFHEVSNGCQPGSYEYYSNVLMDDSWYFVVAWNAGRTDFELCPVISWSDTEILVANPERITAAFLDVHADSLTATHTKVL